jgi:Protein of unknown function (DUF3667)
MHEVLAATISYDSRLLNTLRVLVKDPGGLSKAYVEGVRARYLSPIQLFVWLEAIAFFFNRYLFDRNVDVSNQKSRDLLIVGLGIMMFLSILNAFRRRRVLETVVFVSHLWSFLMLVLVGIYLVLPLLEFVKMKFAPQAHFMMGLAATYTAMAIMLVYVPRALMRMYGDRVLGALFKTAGLVVVTWYIALALEHLQRIGKKW